MSPPPEFGTQLIGQTEKTLNAILDRLLAGSGLDESQWITLTVTVMNNGSLPAGGSISIGFNATYSGTNTKPAAFALNGVTCAAG